MSSDDSKDDLPYAVTIVSENMTVELFREGKSIRSRAKIRHRPWMKPDKKKQIDALLSHLAAAVLKLSCGKDGQTIDVSGVGSLEN